MDRESKHVILGAGGAVTRVLTEELMAAGKDVALVSRSGFSVEGAQAVRGDLLIPGDVDRAVTDGATVYLLAGLPYRASIWQEQWPVIMKNTLAACAAHGAKLIFFDNVYMYGRVEGRMTEDTPISPCSRKGEVRARIADKMLSEISKGNLRGIIARSADFYGPYADAASIPYLFVFSKLAAGKSAQSLVTADTVHSYTYTGDCGRALHLLAQTEDAFNQVWHLPTASPALTGAQFIEIASEKMGVPPKQSVLKKWMLRMASLFNAQVRDVYEMLYQNEFDYRFDSSKFEEHFGMSPTPYAVGIEETIQHFREIGRFHSL